MALIPEETLEDVKEIAKKMDLDILQKASFLMKGMLETGSRRCIVYLNTKDECVKFSKVWKLLGDNYHGHPTASYILYNNVKSEKEDEIINEFKNIEKNHYLSIIINYYGLDKIFKIPRCDSTFLINLNNLNEVNEINEYKIVERFKRGFTEDPLNKWKDNTCFLYCENNNFETLKDFLVLLKSRLYDKMFDKKVIITNQTYDKQVDVNVIKNKKENQERMNDLLVQWNSNDKSKN